MNVGLLEIIVLFSYLLVDQPMLFWPRSGVCCVKVDAQIDVVVTRLRYLGTHCTPSMTKFRRLSFHTHISNCAAPWSIWSFLASHWSLASHWEWGRGECKWFSHFPLHRFFPHASAGTAVCTASLPLLELLGYLIGLCGSSTTTEEETMTW